MKVLVTGSNGFVGRNLCAHLSRRDDVTLFRHDLEDSADNLAKALQSADVIFHVAGVNRPSDPSEFKRGNADFTAEMTRQLLALGRAPRIILASSVQAELDNPYGASKREAEAILRQYCEHSGAGVAVYRLKNLFGKWCRPNYNSVTATFCHNIARGLPIQISDPAAVVALTHIDDVVEAFLQELDTAGSRTGFQVVEPLPSHQITLGDLARLIQSFKDLRETLILPDLSCPFTRALYSTYLSYLKDDDFGYALQARQDERGSLAEFIKSPYTGQIFVSRTKPGVTRGNHFHHLKTEKFLVLEGDAVIRFRALDGAAVVEYPVCGKDFRVVDIPPGYTHSIENVGTRELVTLFWASEPFDPDKPDTSAEHV